MGNMTETNENGARGRWVSPVVRVEKPWGHEEIFANVPGLFAGKALHVTAGSALSLQYHERKEETISLQCGRALLEIGDHESDLDHVELRPGDCVHLLPGTRHRLTAIEDSVVLEASTPDLDDVVRIEDRYGREGTSAP
jgi:mannose-6-phosphate isomerase-like protein (cupin superfamily)